MFNFHHSKQVWTKKWRHHWNIGYKNRYSSLMGHLHDWCYQHGSTVLWSSILGITRSVNIEEGASDVFYKDVLRYLCRKINFEFDQSVTIIITNCQNKAKSIIEFLLLDYSWNKTLIQIEKLKPNLTQLTVNQLKFHLTIFFVFEVFTTFILAVQKRIQMSADVRNLFCDICPTFPLEEFRMCFGRPSPSEF